jgi:hypothetical protein
VHDLARRRAAPCRNVSESTDLLDRIGAYLAVPSGLQTTREPGIAILSAHIHQDRVQSDHDEGPQRAPKPAIDKVLSEAKSEGRDDEENAEEPCSVRERPQCAKQKCQPVESNLDASNVPCSASEVPEI